MRPNRPPFVHLGSSFSTRQTRAARPPPNLLTRTISISSRAKGFFHASFTDAMRVSDVSPSALTDTSESDDDSASSTLPVAPIGDESLPSLPSSESLSWLSDESSPSLSLSLLLSSAGAAAATFLPAGLTASKLCTH